MDSGYLKKSLILSIEKYLEINKLKGHKYAYKERIKGESINLCDST